MMKFSNSIITGLILLVGVKTFSQKEADKFEKLQIEMFPKAKEGYKQVCIQVPIAKNENDLKVEFFVGTEKMIDCNKQFLIGTVKYRNLQGWGYTYYDVESNGKMAGTKIECLEHKLTKEYVYIQPEIVKYNSRLPLIFYVPKDLEVRYRILHPDVDVPMKKGNTIR